MKRVHRSNRRWLWPAALLVLVSLHFWSPKIGTGIRHDSYSPMAEGKLALFYLLGKDPERRGHTVTRNRDPLAKSVSVGSLRIPSSREEMRTICILGPARYPNTAEWKRLLDWVKRGGRLVIAARDDKPEFKIEKLGIEVKRVSGEIDAVSDQIETKLIDSGRIVWRSKAKIVASSDAFRILSADRTTQAVRQNYGSGKIVVVASDFIFSNQSFAWADHSNAALAMRLLENEFGPRDFVFDESLNISGTPKVVGVLLNPLFKPLTVQLLIGLVIFGWWRSMRFGPLLPAAVKARHNIVDHTDAVGALNFKSRDGATALRSYLRQFFSELKFKSFKGREDRVIEPIAVRMGKSVEAIRQLFQKSAKAARNKSLERRAAASIIRKLAIVRRAARRKDHVRGKQTRKPAE